MKYNIDVRQFKAGSRGRHRLVKTVNREVHRMTVAWPNGVGPIEPKSFYWVQYRGVRWALLQTDRLESTTGDNPEIFLPDEVELWPILKRLKGIPDVDLVEGMKVSAVFMNAWELAMVHRLPKHSYPEIEFANGNTGTRLPDEIRGVNEG